MNNVACKRRSGTPPPPTSVVVVKINSQRIDLWTDVLVKRKFITKITAFIKDLTQVRSWYESHVCKLRFAVKSIAQHFLFWLNEKMKQCYKLKRLALWELESCWLPHQYTLTVYYYTSTYVSLYQSKSINFADFLKKRLFSCQTDYFPWERCVSLLNCHTPIPNILHFLRKQFEMFNKIMNILHQTINKIAQCSLWREFLTYELMNVFCVLEKIRVILQVKILLTLFVICGTC